MKPIYDLYCEVIEEKGDEELDQHWSMVFADKIVKEERRRTLRIIDKWFRSLNKVLSPAVKLNNINLEMLKKKIKFTKDNSYEISPCKGCNCMTKTIKGICGKCGYNENYVKQNEGENER